MSALSLYLEAIQRRRSAVAFLSMIGKPQNTTVRNAVGHLRGVDTKTTIYFQETDGAKNYHECGDFDAALSRAVKESWSSLKDRAMAIIDEQVAERKDAARLEYERLFGEAGDQS